MQVNNSYFVDRVCFELYSVLLGEVILEITATDDDGADEDGGIVICRTQL